MAGNPEALIAQAQKLESPQSKIASFFSGGNSMRLEEAAENYIRAANLYRVQNDGRTAGQVFEKAASCQERSEAKDDAANTYVEAYKSYKQTDPKDAARVLTKAIEQFTMRGQFRRAANYQMDLGGIYEDLEMDDDAIEAYTVAGDWYMQDQAVALSNKAYLKVAELSAMREKYDIAIEYFDRVSEKSKDNNLTKWGLKDHFLRAGLCRLARGDTVAAEQCIHKYCEWDASFAQTRECQLLHDLTEAYKEQDVQAFSDKSLEFHQFSTLDKWKTAIMLRIKESIPGVEEDLT